jgi:peptide/nickel transport system permease protein
MPQDFRRYFLKRTAYVVLTVFLILSFNFFLFRMMPGDVARILIPKGADEETITRLTEYYGLDRPLLEQYFTYLKQTFTGHFGESLTVYPGSSIEDLLVPFLLNTIILVGIGAVLSIIVGMYLGRNSAWKRGKITDRFYSTFFIIFYCMPTFLFALVLLTLVGRLSPEWPIKGAYSVDYESYDFLGKLADRTVHTVIPLFALVIQSIALFSIITRSSLTDVLTQEYIVTAVAKGLKNRDILRHHAMPNAMLPIMAAIAMDVGWVISGAIMIEIVFSYQGLGYLEWMAVLGSDYPLIQVIFMIQAVAVIVGNFAADLMLFSLDPRVKI